MISNTLSIVFGVLVKKNVISEKEYEAILEHFEKNKHRTTSEYDMVNELLKLLD